VGVDPQDLGPQVCLEAVHHGDDDDQRRDARKIPAIEMKVMTDTKTCFRLARR
jgi:hypothetical protein